MGQCEDNIKIPFPVVHSILIRRECISCIFWLVERQIRDKKLQLKCGWCVKTTSWITPYNLYSRGHLEPGEQIYIVETFNPLSARLVTGYNISNFLCKNFIKRGNTCISHFYYWWGKGLMYARTYARTWNHITLGLAKLMMWLVIQLPAARLRTQGPRPGLEPGTARHSAAAGGGGEALLQIRPG